MTQSTETVSQRAREIADHFMEAEGDGIVRDMASHVGSEVHDVLKRHGMMMKTVAGAIGMGTLAAVAVLNSTEEFARRSMNDEGEANSVADAIWALFQAELSPAFARISTNKDETIAKLREAVVGRRAIYDAKRGAADPFAEDDRNRRDMMEHTVEAFDILIGEIDALLASTKKEG